MKIKTFDPESLLARFHLFAEGDGGDGGAGGGAGAGAGGDDGAGKGGQGGDGKGGDGGQQQQQQQAKWFDGISNADAKKLAQDSTDINHFAERTLDMRRKLSSAIFIPGKDAKPEEIAAYRQKLGVPEAADKYEFADPEGYQPTEADKALRGKFSEAFFKHNISAEAAKELSALHREAVTAEAEAMKAQDAEYAKQGEVALRKEWGAEYDTNKQFAVKAAQNLFGADYDAVKGMTDKNDRFVMDNPAFMKAMAKIGREMGEDRLGGVVAEGDRKGIQDQIDSLRTQQSEAMAKGDNKKANQLYQEEQALIGKLKGSQPIVGAQGRAA